MLMGWTSYRHGVAAELDDRGDDWGNELNPGSEIGFAEGIARGTLIATDKGWCPVERLTVGSKVLTFDNGAVRVQALSHHSVWQGRSVCPYDRWPLAVPTGALGNKRAMMLMPDQNVMLESDLAEVLYGDPFALVPAAALEGFRSIERACPQGAVEVVSIRFAEDQLIYANGSAMLHCSASIGPGLTIDFLSSTGDYQPMPMGRAIHLVALMAEEDAEEAEEAEVAATRPRHATFS